ncbi:hypothetical protein C8F04DRAFT_1184538 [Mycena alexandri]|uniref:Uncharacterized protein n=1 Tax=Mycena alexandri TaxID=1745969 RepID=A0AAD6SRP7_9AGAR|nr:hypothetical protein C8F04DRAFT_1184538 [Mycena alexandri]
MGNGSPEATDDEEEHPIARRPKRKAVQIESTDSEDEEHLSPRKRLYSRQRLGDGEHDVDEEDGDEVIYCLEPAANDEYVRSQYIDDEAESDYQAEEEEEDDLADFIVQDDEDDQEEYSGED